MQSMNRLRKMSLFDYDVTDAAQALVVMTNRDSQSRQEFADAEWFGQVVIGTCIQCGNFFALLREVAIAWRKSAGNWHPVRILV